MKKFASLCLGLAAVTPLWSQVQPAATGGPSLDDAHMMTPPPVSGDAYPVMVGAESRANYVAGAIVVTGAYNDNLMIDPTHKIGDSTYAIVPSISLDRRSPRISESLEYSSGFNLYQNTTTLNGVTQQGSGSVRFHLRPFTTLTVSDGFYQNSNLFNQSNPYAATGVPAGGSQGTAVYVYPFAQMLGNLLNVGLTHQYSRNALVGASVSQSFLRYAKSTLYPGLEDSDVRGASGFFSRRFSRNQYAGVNYNYSKITTTPLHSRTDTHTILGFYTLFFSPTVSVSVLGGPQRFTSRDPVSGTSISSWTPALQGSAGFQMAHTSFSASYSRIVSSARGLVGAYHSNLASVGVRRKLTRIWSVDGNADYALFKNATPSASYLNQGGHTISATASVNRSFRERIAIQAGYSRFHQSYNFGANTPVNPDADRLFGSFSYSFSKALGR